jgi:HK97 family phage portal protein
MAFWDRFNPARLFSAGKKPDRQTSVLPNFQLLGQGIVQPERPAYKATPRNLRYFARTPFARRAINAIKNPIAGMDWEIRPKKDVAMTAELKQQCKAVTNSFSNPNYDDSFRSLIEITMEDLLCGAAAIEQRASTDPDRPVWLFPVDGLSIQVYPLWSGKPNEPRYMQVIGYGQAAGAHQGIDLTNRELIYLRPNPASHTPFGFGPLETAFMSIARQLGVAEYAGNVASNARPDIILNLGEGADLDKILAFRQYWKAEIEGQGQLPIIGGKDASVIRLTAEGDSALFLKYQEFLVREIAAAFDLSPQNLGIEHDVNRNTSEAGKDRDWDQAIKPWADMIASHLTRECINGLLGYLDIEFAWVGLDREDEQASAEIFKTYYDANVITPNEQRKKIGLPPSKSQWADLFYADVQIAISAARGVKVIDDENLPENYTDVGVATGTAKALMPLDKATGLPSSKPSKSRKAKPKGKSNGS